MGWFWSTGCYKSDPMSPHGPARQHSGNRVAMLGGISIRHLDQSIFLGGVWQHVTYMFPLWCIAGNHSSSNKSMPSIAALALQLAGLTLH